MTPALRWEHREAQDRGGPPGVMRWSIIAMSVVGVIVGVVLLVLLAIYGWWTLVVPVLVAISVLLASAAIAEANK